MSIAFDISVNKTGRLHFFFTRSKLKSSPNTPSPSLPKENTTTKFLTQRSPRSCSLYIPVSHMHPYKIVHKKFIKKILNWHKNGTKYMTVTYFAKPFQRTTFSTLYGFPDESLLTRRQNFNYKYYNQAILTLN